jgi:hypothetical protein
MEIAMAIIKATLAIVLFVFGAWLFLYPIIRIIRRMGFSGWWVLLYFFPPAMLIGLWRIAYRRWPAVDPPDP